MFVRDDVDDPTPGPGEVLVEVEACGICGSDLHFVRYGADMLEKGERMEAPSTSAIHTRPRPGRVHGPRVQRSGARRRPSADGPAPGALVSVPIAVTDTGIHDRRQPPPVRLQRADAAVGADHDRGAERPRPTHR
jgi:hypothetical protein